MKLVSATASPSKDPVFTDAKNSAGKARFPAKILKKYMDSFEELISAADAPVDAQDIIDEFPEVKPSTVTNHLKTYIDVRRETIEKGMITGIYPGPETIISMAERAVGKVTENTLSRFNEKCKELIDTITFPRHQRFVHHGIEKYVDRDTGKVIASQSALVDFCYKKYRPFVSESANSMMSLAGSINERILIRALENGGLKLGQHVVKTGTNSEADLLIKDPTGTNALHCELKSYAARERLLRGLQDIGSSRKIGVGFFQDATEFNPRRTQTLLGASPWAIYLPDTTFNSLDPKSKSQKTSKQDSLYRPLSRFVSDMIHYNQHGSLPAF